MPAAASRSCFKAAISKRIEDLNAAAASTVLAEGSNPDLEPTAARAAAASAVKKHAVERVVVSAPAVSARSQGRLERYAWVVMKTVEGANEVIKSLREKEVSRLFSQFLLLRL